MRCADNQDPRGWCRRKANTQEVGVRLGSLSSEALGLVLRGAHVQWNKTNGMGGEVLGVQQATVFTCRVPLKRKRGIASAPSP